MTLSSVVVKKEADPRPSLSAAQPRMTRDSLHLTQVSLAPPRYEEIAPVSCPYSPRIGAVADAQERIEEKKQRRFGNEPVTARGLPNLPNGELSDTTAFEWNHGCGHSREIRNSDFLALMIESDSLQDRERLRNLNQSRMCVRLRFGHISQYFGARGNHKKCR
jgi:hypothetical protein